MDELVKVTRYWGCI